MTVEDSLFWWGGGGLALGICDIVHIEFVPVRRQRCDAKWRICLLFIGLNISSYGLLLYSRRRRRRHRSM